MPQRNALLQYIYSPAEAGLNSWPSGELRLDGVEVTDNPEQADVFVCPGNLSLFQVNGVIQKDLIYKLPYLAGNEHRSVFLDISDNFKQAIGMPCLFIKCDVRDWMLKDDPNSINFAWPVEDYAECVDIPAGGFLHDVSAHMWNWSEARRESAQSCLDTTALNCDFALYDDFTGYLKAGDPELIRRRSEFRRSMRESRVALCPESIPGVFPYRFFEAMSAGRVPVLVASDVVFPFADEIPYSSFILHIERSDAARTGELIAQFLRWHNDRQLEASGAMARKYWLQYLNSADWPKLMAMAVEKKLGVLAAK